ncbi:glycoside hydrolase family 68 protein [Antiquaquibacter soli]|uniref:beta-fructofuranosidase n=1 Tax=Antiquaquibacter soli TaxID=3064523 RepID=A0ABT9BR19_9MICO|nr:glycoside hydrolase family 68 protein [Protaetiibacter sp. WY-16]MDO7883461.1 glycoside hydrolase family 68 protein [Protaetiibacter sp. WY-16]
MTFTLDAHWVWDFWLADDGELFHLYYLHAPKSLGDPHLRHRNARVGHATSTDLRDWTDLGEVLAPGPEGAFDGSATWTGSVVAAPDGSWRMFYTGSRFLSADSHANVETVGVAVSRDLHSWTKLPGPIVTADPRWYEVLGTSEWPEEAWRDPWVYRDPSGEGWHMLLTARSASGDVRDRGVIAHATSDDLEHWTVQPPLSEPGAGFAHLEVPQLVEIDGSPVLLFSCDSPALAGERAGSTGGIWALVAESTTGPFDAKQARLVVDESLYSGRVIRDRSGRCVMLAFENSTADGGFSGVLSDPLPVAIVGGMLELSRAEAGLS